MAKPLQVPANEAGLITDTIKRDRYPLPHPGFPPKNQPSNNHFRARKKTRRMMPSASLYTRSTVASSAFSAGDSRPVTGTAEGSTVTSRLFTAPYFISTGHMFIKTAARKYFTE